MQEEELGIRLNKYVANAGICSRRKADELIKQGEVYVNGEAVLEMGFRVKTNDVVTYQGKKLESEKKVYILLNKPKNFITTTSDERGRRTVMELVKQVTKQARIYPIGRLDRNTTGLLLFTNDGEFAQNLAHPSSEVYKLYQVSLDKPLSMHHFKTIAESNVSLEEGKVPIDEIAFPTEDYSIVGLQIHVGWNRVVRRVFETLGYTVQKLDRVMYAGLTKKDLPRGKWRHLTPEEIRTLKHFR